MLKLLFAISLSLSFNAIHEFHTSLMGIVYNEDSRAFEIEIDVDTEHFEMVINEVYETDVHLGEPNEIEDLNDLIEAYLNEQITLRINNKIVGLTVSCKEVDYATTFITLEPIAHKRKVKSISLINTYMLEKYPAQKNLVHIYYRDEKRSLLFDSSNSSEDLKF